MVQTRAVANCCDDRALTFQLKNDRGRTGTKPADKQHKVLSQISSRIVNGGMGTRRKRYHQQLVASCTVGRYCRLLTQMRLGCVATTMCSAIAAARLPVRIADDFENTYTDQSVSTVHLLVDGALRHSLLACVPVERRQLCSLLPEY